MKDFLALLFFVLVANIALASCFGKKYYLTEILANQDDKHHIFTCEILSTSSGPGGYTSLALVKNVYRGTPVDTVYIVTGGYTTAGGDWIHQGTEWLIISESRDNLHYTATICHNLSARIDDYEIKCSRKDNVRGKKYLRIVGQYFDLEKKKYSGKKDLEIDGDVFAQASFVNGKADGRWKHYWYSYELKKQALVAEMEYRNGRIEGKVVNYVEHLRPKMIEYESYTKDGLLQYESRCSNRIREYTYPSETQKNVLVTWIDKLGDTVHISNIKHIDCDNVKQRSLSYKEGYYFNMIDSSAHKPLEAGVYWCGVKVGKWNYFNKAGETINTEDYEYPDTTSKKTIVLGDRVGFRHEGVLKKGRRIGLWKQYFNDKIENEFYYNTNSKLDMIVRYYSKGGRLITPYVDEKIYGTQIELDSNSRVKMLCDYRDGSKNGRYIRYDVEGNISQESSFENGRETTIFSTSTNAPMVDGFRHGYNIQLAGYTDWKMYEGQFHMGQKVGKHIDYRKDGSISSISYHPTLKELEERKKIENPCEHPFYIKKEYYTVDGELFEESEY